MRIELQAKKDVENSARWMRVDRGTESSESKTCNESKAMHGMGDIESAAVIQMMSLVVMGARMRASLLSRTSAIG